jgi:anti-sigma28 factor (negative regulator of flagellin synthesis)
MIAAVKIRVWTKEACRLADKTDVEKRMMKLSRKGREATAPCQLIQDDKAASQIGRDKRTEVGPTVESAKFYISQKAQELQRITELLARRGDELRVKKIRQVKETVAKAEYAVDPREVAKSIIRTSVARHLEKSKIQSTNIDLTELFVLIEDEIALEKKLRLNVEKTVVASDVVTLSQQIDTREPSPASSTFSTRRIPC